MLEAIHKNKLRTQELRKQMIEMNKKQQKAYEKIFIAFIVLGIVIILMLLNIIRNKGIMDCIKSGHNIEFCETMD